MNFKVFLEIFGSFNYEVPDDKEQQLFDFYMLNNLAGRSAMDNRRMKAYATSGQDIGTKMSSMDGAGDMSEDDKINYMLDEVKQKLLPVLKNNLLDAVFFSISAEFRHIFDYNKTKNILSYLDDDEEIEAFKQYAKNLSLFQDSRTDGVVRLPTINPEVLGQNKDRNSSFYAASKVRDRATFVRMCNLLFEKAQWSSMFGGPAWAGIAQAWLGLDKAQKYSELFVQIDHVYDIQHNNGTVLNKVDSYAKNGNYSWLTRALNFKADIKDPFEIIEHVSPRMKKFAIRAIKNKTGKSWEQFGQERSNSDEGQYVQAVAETNKGFEAIVGITLTKVLDKRSENMHPASVRNIIDSHMKLLEKHEVISGASKGTFAREIAKHVGNFDILKEELGTFDIERIRKLDAGMTSQIINEIHSKPFHDILGQSGNIKDYSAMNSPLEDKMDYIKKAWHFPEEYAKYLVFFYTLVEKRIEAAKSVYGQGQEQPPESSTTRQVADSIFKANHYFVDAAATILMHLDHTPGEKVDLKMNKLLHLFYNKSPNDDLIAKQIEVSYKQIVGRYNQHMHNFKILSPWFGPVTLDYILKLPLENMKNIYSSLINQGLHITTNPNLDSFDYININPMEAVKKLRQATGYTLEYARLLAMYITLRKRMVDMNAAAQKSQQPAIS